MIHGSRTGWFNVEAELYWFLGNNNYPLSIWTSSTLAAGITLYNLLVVCDISVCTYFILLLLLLTTIIIVIVAIITFVIFHKFNMATRLNTSRRPSSTINFHYFNIRRPYRKQQAIPRIWICTSKTESTAKQVALTVSAALFT